MSSSPNLYFEYADEEGSKNPLLFEDPLKVIQTHQLDEIENVFVELEKATQQGYYVAGYVAYEAKLITNPTKVICNVFVRALKREIRIRLITLQE